MPESSSVMVESLNMRNNAIFPQEFSVSVVEDRQRLSLSPFCTCSTCDFHRPCDLKTWTLFNHPVPKSADFPHFLRFSNSCVENQKKKIMERICSQNMGPKDTFFTRKSVLAKKYRNCSRNRRGLPEPTLEPPSTYTHVNIHQNAYEKPRDLMYN